MLKVNEIGFKRDEVWLWHNINFELDKGQLLQISGTNGAGKTTLLKVLTALTQPHTGEIDWQGTPVNQQRESYHQQLQYLGHQNAVKADLTVIENLYLNTHAIIHDAIDSTLAKVGLASHKNHFAHQISQGQKQRLALARLMLSPALLWILDEPLAGLDAQVTELCQNWFSEHLNRGGMIIFTSHQPLNITAIKTFTLHLS